MSAYTDKDYLESVTGKAFTNSKVFPHDVQSFKAIHDAERFCREKGFSVGRMQADAPMGIKQGSWDIQKWRNLSAKDRKRMDGVIVGEKRYGPVTVYWADDASAA